MSFIVEHLEVKDFRNYEWFLLELAKDLTVIVGPNATGKTNLIEALSLVTAGESFRKPRWADVIRRGAGQARVSLTASDGMRPLSVVLDIEEKRGRSYRLNGRARRSVSAATGTIPCVLFTPDDLTMVRGSSEMRRAPLDALGSQMSSTYDALRKQYHRILRQRNALLREAARQAEIEPWTESLVETGSRLIEHRRRLLDRIGAQMSAIHTELAEGDSVAVRYIPSWEREGGFTETLETGSLAEAVSNAANRERERGATITGPHRDDVEITLNGVPARVFASQGQQRTIVLAWKLAEVAVIEDVLKARPLLLLDDVMSELDEERRHALASRVKGAAQTVITTTNLHYFEEDELSSGRVVQLHEPEA